MQDIVISNGQNVLDAMVQYFGDLEQAFDFALEQNLSVSDFVEPGVFTTALEPNKANVKIIETLNKPEWIPATNDNQEPSGIGIGAIGIDFEIG